ncbi:MAG: glycosyl hydrolase 115 family protein [Firmicutes bacterium]|nr:glycosyl hydrolase 115 family protein [Bacillota bacterium]
MCKEFILFDGGTAADLYIESGDWDGAAIALNALQNDIEMVSGVRPQAVNSISSPGNGMAVIVGTIGKSATINKLAADSKINITNIQNKWESYLLQVVDNPFDGVESALVVAGSDKRGTIFGIYEISRMIGVSPWVWWGDCVPERKSRVSFPADFRVEQGEPSVKYRGFFLNDEAPSLSGWMSKHFPKVANPQATQGCGNQFYTKVFELLLRLKGNYLWPVMWNNSFHTDDPQNTVLADKYGVVMGTSHHEHMTCADKEWNWSKLGDWNYATNRENIYKFWHKGTEERKNYESIITLGMRGQADTSILGPNATLKDNMDLMQKVLTDQREIIGNVFGAGDGAPQMLALYKEVEAFYYGDGTNKLHVPEDVTLMLCDDNFGNLRTLPTDEMLKRPGGFGMYYHFDYRGWPISYEWINQTPLSKIWDNMTRAYEGGIRQIWIVNVGDLKPMELPLDYFMALAYDYETWKEPNKTKEFTQKWAAREFGPGVAEETEKVISGYLKILGARKVEVVHADTFSLNNFDEANRVLGNFEQIVAKAESIYDSLPEHKKAAFYQMVLYPARGALNVYKTQIYAAWSLNLAEKGDLAANEYAMLAREAFARDAAETEYYNTKLSGGKWDGIMRQNHMGYTAWNSPHIHVIPETMPPVGEVLPDEALPQPTCEAVTHPVLPNVPPNTYVETCGYVSINPAKFAKSTPCGKGEWTVIDGYGREFDSVKVMPGTVSFAPDEESPTLEYKFLIQNPAVYTVNIFIAPTNNPYHFTVKPLAEQLRFSVQADDGEVVTVSGVPEEFDVGHGYSWSLGVMDNVRIVPVPGPLQLAEGLHSLRIYAVDPGVVIEKIVIAPAEEKQTLVCGSPLTSHCMGAYFGPPESAFVELTP